MTIDPISGLYPPSYLCHSFSDARIQLVIQSQFFWLLLDIPIITSLAQAIISQQEHILSPISISPSLLVWPKLSSLNRSTFCLLSDFPESPCSLFSDHSWQSNQSLKDPFKNTSEHRTLCLLQTLQRCPIIDEMRFTGFTNTCSRRIVPFTASTCLSGFV